MCSGVGSLVLRSSIHLAFMKPRMSILNFWDSVRVIDYFIATICGMAVRCVPIGARACSRIFCNHRPISRRHCDVVRARGLLRVARVLIEEFDESLICILVQVMNLVSSSQEIGNSLGRRLVDNR